MTTMNNFFSLQHPDIHHYNVVTSDILLQKSGQNDHHDDCTVYSDALTIRASNARPIHVRNGNMLSLLYDICDFV
jgi:hypothetical protein